MSEQKINIGVNVILEREGKVLLGKRKNVFGHGTWGFPGGHLEWGESCMSGAQRELFEETGMTVDNLEFVSIINQPSSQHYIQINFFSQKFQGEPELREPDACEKWEWFDIHNLPSDMFPPHAQFIPSLLEKKMLVDVDGE